MMHIQTAGFLMRNLTLLNFFAVIEQKHEKTCQHHIRTDSLSFFYLFSLCADWFVLDMVGNPKDSFSMNKSDK